MEPNEVVQQVAALLERRRTVQARGLLTSALQSHPDHSGLLLQAAWTDYLDDRNDEALATTRRVLSEEPHNVNARELLFAVLKDKEEYPDAEQVVIGLLRDYPEASGLYGGYADLMLRTLNLEKAKRLATEGLKLDPDDGVCLNARAICEIIEQPRGAANQGLQQLLVRNPNSLQTLCLVVAALEQRGESRAASRLARELAAAQPDNKHLVEMAQAFTINTHWSLLPLWPMQKWGWGASVAIWLLTIVIARSLGTENPRAAGIFVGVMLIYVVYSWVWPQILKRLMSR